MNGVEPMSDAVVLSDRMTGRPRAA